MQIISSDLTNQSLVGELPSRKISIEAPAPAKVKRRSAFNEVNDWALST